MDYAEAAKKFDEVLEFMREQKDLSSSYVAMANAVSNRLKLKAAVEQTTQKNKKSK